MRAAEEAFFQASMKAEARATGSSRILEKIRSLTECFRERGKETEERITARNETHVHTQACYQEGVWHCTDIALLVQSPSVDALHQCKMVPLAFNGTTHDIICYST